MSVQVPEDLPGAAEAAAELDRLMAAEAAAAGTPDGKEGATPTDPDPSADPAGAADAASTNEQTKTDTAAGDAAPAEGESPPKPKGDADGKGKTAPDAEGKGEAGKSRFARAQERLGRTWEDVNAAKAALQAEQDALKAARETLAREREEFSAQRQQAEAEFQPDQYDAAAQKFEAEGKFDLADLARAKAEELRRHPPAPAADRTAAQRKEWALKAGTEFPALTKANSPLQVRVAQLLQEEPDLKAHPKGLYLAARLADLETQAAQARQAQAAVTAKEQELVKLKERISELEGLTAPGSGDGVTRLPASKPFEQLSGDEQLAELERQARDMGVLAR